MLIPNRDKTRCNSCNKILLARRGLFSTVSYLSYCRTCKGSTADTEFTETPLSPPSPPPPPPPPPWLLITLIVLSIVGLTFYWTIRLFAGLVWIPAIVVCAPLWLRAFATPEALTRHKRGAWASLVLSIVPFFSYGFASLFNMTSDPFQLAPISLGGMLLLSVGLCLLTGIASLVAWRFHRKVNALYSNCCRGNGFGIVTLIPAAISNRFFKYSVDALLAFGAAACFVIGGGWVPLGVMLGLMITYTWFWDYRYD